MGLRILQFSDLHIGKEFLDNTDFISNVEIALRSELNRNKTVDIVVVTGDIFDGKVFSKDEYKIYIDKAVNLFEDMIDEFNIKLKSNLSKESFYFIPGNHELDRVAVKKGGCPFNKYDEFLIEFYGDLPKYYDKKHRTFFKVFEKERIMLLGFNSANYEYMQSDGEAETIERDFGLISAKQLSDATFFIDSLDDKDEYKLVACLHHHFYLIEDRNKSKKDFSVLENHTQFLSNLKKYNLDLIFHGHKHESTNRRLMISDSLSQVDKIVNVVGCGSSNKMDIGYNSFNFIEVYGLEESLDLDVTEYKYTNSQFEASTSIQLPLVETQKVNIKILDEFRKCGKKEKLYRDFKEMDTATNNDDIFKSIDKTIGSLPEMVKLIETNPNLIVYLLLPIHYRCGIHFDDQFLGQLQKLFLSVKDNEFNNDLKLNKIYEILETDSIYQIYSKYDDLRNQCTYMEKRCLALLMISVFIVELHIVLRSKAEDFFFERISKKSNISFEKGTINQSIKGNRIEFECDDDRRAIYISVICNSANAHKIVSLITKEFDLLLTRYEDDFTSVGFRVYYIQPKINKLQMHSEVCLESYNFEAHIPKLIPLLAGENLYTHVEAFSRELIQNSIDAINVRVEKSSIDFSDGQIEIEIGKEDGQKYFQISDNGVGMSKYILERYFTSIGRSFYNSEDFYDLDIDYSPISMFGIGFLSCFVVGKRVDVTTKYYMDENNENKGYLLEIPNFDGCFFIENNKKSKIGTCIKIYEDKEKKLFDENRILDYVKDTIKNIPFKIEVKNMIQNSSFVINEYHLIHEIIEKTYLKKLMFIVPLRQEFSHERVELKDSQFEKYSECIIFYKKDIDIDKGQEISLTNHGIKVNNILGILEDEVCRVSSFFDTYINVPSGRIELDVSRDILKALDMDWEYVSNKLSKQIKRYINNEQINMLEYRVLMKISPHQFNIFKLQTEVNRKSMKIRYSKNLSTLRNILGFAETMLNRVVSTNKERTEINIDYSSFSDEYIELQGKHVLLNDILDSELELGFDEIMQVIKLIMSKMRYDFKTNHSYQKLKGILERKIKTNKNKKYNSVHLPYSKTTDYEYYYDILSDKNTRVTTRIIDNRGSFSEIFSAPMSEYTKLNYNYRKITKDSNQIKFNRTQIISNPSSIEKLYDRQLLYTIYKEFGEIRSSGSLKRLANAIIICIIANDLYIKSVFSELFLLGDFKNGFEFTISSFFSNTKKEYLTS